jgi:hypothetical protein
MPGFGKQWGGSHVLVEKRRVLVLFYAKFRQTSAYQMIGANDLHPYSLWWRLPSDV